MFTLANWRWNCCVGIWFVLSCLAAAPLAAQDRFLLWQQSGKLQPANRISQLYENTNEPFKLNDQPISVAQDELLALRCATVNVNETAGYRVRFTNGDVIPARITGFIPGQQSNDKNSQLTRIELVIEPPGISATSEFGKQVLQVRPECIAAYYSGYNARSLASERLVEYGAGREIKVRASQFRQQGLECLTEKGVLTIPYDQLRAASWPSRSDSLLSAQDGLWSQPNEHYPAVVQLHTTRGAILTAGNQLVIRHRSYDQFSTLLWIQPNWSLNAIGIRPEHLTWVCWRQPEQIPLTTLHYVAKNNTSGIQQWPEQLHRSVTGSPLQVGQLQAAQGLGTHAGTELHFRLPANAKKFRSWVGLNQSVGQGGCARVRIHRNEATGELLWESDFLRGGQEPVLVEIELRQVETLVLVIDSAHDKRPAGADPWDIRDHVDWLWPMISCTTDQLTIERRKAAQQPGRWIPALTDFQLVEAAERDVELKPVWCNQVFRWGIYAQNRAAKNSGVAYRRKLDINYANALLRLSAGLDMSTGRDHQLLLESPGGELPSTYNGPLKTAGRNARQNEFDTRQYHLGQQLGQQLELTLRLQPEEKIGPQAGVLIDTLQMSPLVEDLAADGKLLVPQIALTSQKPQQLPAEATWATGQTMAGKPLTMNRMKFDQGTAIPGGQELSFRLDPSWTEFVAVIGLADGWQGIQSIQLLLDGQLHWECDTRFDRNSPARQIRVPLPAGHQTMTIKVQGRESLAGFGNAGFMTAENLAP